MGDPSGGDQLAAERRAAAANGTAQRFLPDGDSGRASRVHAGCEVLDVFCGQQVRELRLVRLQLSELLDIGELHRLNCSRPSPA
jgi:hypothetical protein